MLRRMGVQKGSIMSNTITPTVWLRWLRNALREDATALQRRVVDAVLKAGSYDEWAASCAPLVGRVLTLLDELRLHGVFDVSTLSVALRELRALA